MFLFEIVLNPCLCLGGGGGRTARGRVCGCAALRATASRAWSGGGSATAATTRPPRTPGHTGRRHLHQTFGKLLYIHTYLSSNIFHKYHQYTLSIYKVESFAWECASWLTIHTALLFTGLLTIFFGFGFVKPRKNAPRIISWSYDKAAYVAWLSSNTLLIKTMDNVGRNLYSIPTNDWWKLLSSPPECHYYWYIYWVLEFLNFHVDVLLTKLSRDFLEVPYFNDS